MLADLPDGYHLDRLREAVKFSDQRRVAVDVGAHRGIWARELARHFESVYAFEPRREFASQIGPGITTHAVALGSGFGRCSIREGDENTGQAHVVPGDDVFVRPLDAFNIQEVDFLKIDVEGYERHVISGAIQTIQDWRPILMVEQNGLCERYGYTDKDLSKLISELGYELITNWTHDYLYKWTS